MNSSQISSDATSDSPWLGLRSFSESDAAYFFGREMELNDLRERVVHKPLTVLFGQSGWGKTSLLQAGLIPQLRKDGFLPVLVRLAHHDSAGSLETQVIDALAKALREARCEKIADAITTQLAQKDQANLWLLLHDPVFGLSGADGTIPQPVFIFDQFEEMFTQGDKPERKAPSLAFRDALASLVENRPAATVRQLIANDDELADRINYQARSYRVLLALRYDFLHLLERWRKQMPSLMDNRMELRLLAGPQAFEAVIRPGQMRQGRPPIIPDDVGRAIVRFVVGALPDTPLAEIDAVPPLLSLICSELNAQRLALGQDQVSQSQFEGSGGEILNRFYERSFDPLTYGTPLESVPHGMEILLALRRLIEDRLLSADGFRESIAFDTMLWELSDAADSDAAKKVLTLLVERRLLSVDERGGVQRLELTHDVLAPIVKANRDERHEREALANAKRDQESAEAETRRALFERNRLRRFAIVAGISAVLAFSAAITAVFFFVQTKQRQKELRTSLLEVERKKQEQGALRERADSVMVFMMKDVTRVFREQGHFTMLTAITEQVERYNNATRQKTDDSGSRLLAAKALTERATVADNSGKVAEAMKLMREQIAILQQESPDQIESRLQLLAVTRQLAHTILSLNGHQEPWTSAAPIIADGRKIAEDLQARMPEKLEVIGASARMLVVVAKYARKESITANSQANETTALLGANAAQESAKVKQLRELAATKDREASSFFQQALAMIRDQSETALSNPDLAEAASIVIWSYGQYLKEKGEYTKAISHFEEDLQQNESILKRDHANQKARFAMALDLREIGQTYAYEVKNLPKAIEYYQRALKVTNEMVMMAPSSTDGWWENWFLHQKLANSLRDLASKYKKQPERAAWLDEMWEHRQAELVAARRLVEIEPQSLRWRSLFFDSLDDFCWTVPNYLDFLREGSSNAKVLAASQLAVAVANEQREQHKDEIKTRSARVNLAAAYLAIGQAFAFIEDFKASREAYELVFPVTELLPQWKPSLFEDNRGPAALGIALLCEREVRREEVLTWLETATRYDPSQKAFLRLAEIYEAGTGVPKDTTKADTYRKQADRRTFKQFNIPMPVGPTEMIPVQFYVGRDFADGRTPLEECNRQLEFLREKGVYLPPDVNVSLKKLWDIAVENKVEFVDLLTYTLNYPTEDDPKKLPDQPKK